MLREKLSFTLPVISNGESTLLFYFVKFQVLQYLEPFYFKTSGQDLNFHLMRRKVIFLLLFVCIASSFHRNASSPREELPCHDATSPTPRILIEIRPYEEERLKRRLLFQLPHNIKLDIARARIISDQAKITHF